MNLDQEKLDTLRHNRIVASSAPALHRSNHPSLHPCRWQFNRLKLNFKSSLQRGEMMVSPQYPLTTINGGKGLADCWWSCSSHKTCSKQIQVKGQHSCVNRFGQVRMNVHAFVCVSVFMSSSLAWESKKTPARIWMQYVFG